MAETTLLGGTEDHDLAGPYARRAWQQHAAAAVVLLQAPGANLHRKPDRKSTRLNSSHT